MDLSLELMGVPSVPTRTSPVYPVSILHATGSDCWEEINQTAIHVPAPTGIPPHLTGFSGLSYLFTAWEQAAKWTLMPEDRRRKGVWIWNAILKSEEKRKTLLDSVEQLHALRATKSQLAPLLWAWWQINRKLEAGGSGLEFLSIWGPKALASSQMRRWFYEQVNFEVLGRRRFWPKASAAALELLHDFSRKASLVSPDEQRALWANTYSTQYAEMLSRAKQVQDDASWRISEKIKAHDLGVWLSADVMSYLKVKDASPSLQTSTGLTKRRRSAKP